MRTQVKPFWMNAFFITATVCLWLTLASGIYAGIQVTRIAHDSDKIVCRWDTETQKFYDENDNYAPECAK